MRCPYCKQWGSRVVDSRSAEDGGAIRRRRECPYCGKRFTTYETVERATLVVIKNDGRREVFDREKLLRGIVRSADKRNISMEKIEQFVAKVEGEIRNTMEREIPTKIIGEKVMDALKDFDEVAYIRFASVYRKFADVESFREELEKLIRKRQES